MKKLGAYINGDTYGGGTILEENTFVWYEVVRKLTENIEFGDIYEVCIWSLKGGYPNGRKPDAKFKTTNPQLIENTVIPIKEVADKYRIKWENCNWKIKNWMARYDYHDNYEYLTELKVDRFGSNDYYCHLECGGERAMSVLKDAKVKLRNMITLNDCTMRSVLGDMFNEELKKSLEQDAMKSALNSCYGMGGFTTSNTFVSNRILEVSEALKIWENKNKETKTMEKKTMTETDTFLKHMNGITITSTYSKLDFGDFGDPYYIYYPETNITEDIADTLLTVLLMAKREYIHKVVFNPEKGTTTISKNVGDPVTVRCRDGKFDYILGYEMARSKMYLGHNDYNWFNKIKNHRKTHIEYTEKKPTEPKAKRTSKKGGKKS